MKTAQILEFIIAAIFSWLLVGAILPLLRRAVIDIPNSRSAHLHPTPRGGGIAFVIVGTLMSFVSTSADYRWVPVMCIPLAIVGLVDDYKSVPAFFRYLVQVMTGFALLLNSDIQHSSLGFLLLIVAITAIINFINFMDGLDGLVAGCGVLLMASTSSWCLSGAIFGFLFWNWSPARVFMGDIGSTFIGSTFAGMILQTNSSEETLRLLLIGFPLFGDSLFCLVRRLFNGEHVFKPHKKHLFQRLQQAGWSHSNVALLYIFGVGFLWVANEIGGTYLLASLVGIELLFGMILDRFYAKPYSP